MYGNPGWTSPPSPPGLLSVASMGLGVWSAVQLGQKKGKWYHYVLFASGMYSALKAIEYGWHMKRPATPLPMVPVKPGLPPPQPQPVPAKPVQ